MRIRGIEVEDFINYKYPSMFMAIGDCDWKCCADGGFDIKICQNSSLAQTNEVDIDNEFIYHIYINNPITQAIVIGGLEPMTRFNDIYNLIKYFRNNNCNDTFVIYTGYYPNEIKKYLEALSKFDNIIIKFGRYKQDSNPIFDEVLGVELASDNQYAIALNEVLDKC